MVGRSLICSRNSKKIIAARGEWGRRRVGRDEAGETRPGKTGHGEKGDFILSAVGNLWKI